MGPDQLWAGSQVRSNHMEVLYLYGETVMFTLMWRPQDFDAGRVGYCTTCYGSSRSARAFAQATERRCADCYGTTYEGGYRAQILRPALLSDRNTDSVDSERGAVITDSLTVETAPDFTCHSGDYLFRFDNARYRCEEMSETILRSGFAEADSADSISGSISAAHLEDPSSVAYLIPPDATLLRTWLTSANLGHVVSDLSGYETVRPGGYL